MARPRKSDTEKRTLQLNIRLNASESTRLKAYAKSCFKTPTEVVRMKVFSGKFPAVKMAVLDIETYRELKRIGVNVNQAVHKLNQLGEKGEYILQSVHLMTLLNKVVKAVLDNSK